jgi:hypothetical protein
MKAQQTNIYHIVYKTTNLVNKKIYIGVHSAANLLDDYIGSGRLLKKAIKKYGKEYFKREILFQFSTLKECYQKEAELVTEDFVKDENTYNVCVGGRGGRNGMVTARDVEGNVFNVFQGDERLKSGELFGIARNKVMIKTKSGEIIKVDKSDERIKDDRSNIFSTAKNKVPVKDDNGNTFRVDKNDPRLISGELKHVTKNTIQVRDNNGNHFRVNTDDKRLQTGEILPQTVGYVSVKDSNGKTFQVSKDDPRLKNGELVGVNSGKIYITNGIINTLIKKNEEMPKGFWKGRTLFKKNNLLN